MGTRLRHLYESLSGFSVGTQIVLLDEFITAFNSESRTTLANLFHEALMENRLLPEISEPIISDEMLEKRHKTEQERQAREKESKGTVSVTNHLKRRELIQVDRLGRNYCLRYLQREVPHLRKMGVEKRRNKAWIDYVGEAQGSPVVGEIKCRDDQNSFYAFVQLLTYLSELATPNQVERAEKEKLFGSECQDYSKFDLHILLVDRNEASKRYETIEPTRELATKFRESLAARYSETAALIGGIYCLSTTDIALGNGDDLLAFWSA